MAGKSLLNPTQKIELSRQKVEISEPLYSEAMEYAQWVGIETFDDMVAQSIDYVLNSDKGWKKHLKEVTSSPASVKPKTAQEPEIA